MADDSDVASVREFGEAHIRPHYEPLIGAEAAAAQVRDWWSVEAITRAVSEREIIIAESGSRLIGVAQVSTRSDPATIYKLYVHPEWRGRGVGAIMLEAVVRTLPGGTSRIAVEHFAANDRAAHFYEREGFVVERVSDARSGKPSLAIVWRVKTLA